MNAGRYSGTGIASLVLIFSILCFTAVSLLSLSSASEETSLTQKYKTSVENYYLADATAVETVSELIKAINSGYVPSNINGMTIYTDGNGIYSFSCPIDELRCIFVSVKSDVNNLEILAWQEEDKRSWNPDEKIEVWTGEKISKDK